MIKQPTLINEAYFKAFSPIPRNYNIEEIENYFNVAEKLWVVPIIGLALYDELLGQVEENKVTEENSTLLINLYPYLSYAIIYESLPFISYNFSEVGITKGKSENSESIDIKDVNYINTHIRNQVEVLKNQFKEWMDMHKEHFPLYKPKEECNKCIDKKYAPNFFRSVYKARKIDIDIK